MTEGKSDPLALFDQLSASRAARETEEVEQFEFGVDQTQVKRDAERRSQGDQLRARPRSRARPITGRVVRGYMETSGSSD